MQTPATGRPRLAPSARAVAIPIRRPVKEPGPSPTPIRSDRVPAARSARPRAPPRRAAPSRGAASPRRRARAATRGGPRRRAVAQTAVSSVAVSKPTTTGSRSSLTGNGEDEEADAFALDEPGHFVFARDVGLDLVHVQRALDRLLLALADRFLRGRELDADRVEDVAVVALEEGALLAPLRAGVRRFRISARRRTPRSAGRRAASPRPGPQSPAAPSPTASRSASSGPSLGRLLPISGRVAAPMLHRRAASSRNTRKARWMRPQARVW